MKCPICGKDINEEFAEGCICGYSKNIFERIGSLLEYNGQRMTTYSALILAVVIGMFSVTNLTRGIGVIISSFFLVVLSVLGYYLIERLEEVRNYNMVLEGFLRMPTILIEKWKNICNQKKGIVRFYEALDIHNRMKKNERIQRKRKPNESRYSYYRRLIFSNIKIAKFFYLVSIVLLFVYIFFG